MVFNNVLEDFPLLKRVNYLSTASIGLVPNSVINKSIEVFVDLAQGGTLALDEEKEVSIYENLRNESSKLFNCNKEEIAVFNSVSEAMNVIAWSLGMKSGQVLSTSEEFPSVTYPWLRLGKDSSLSIDFIKAKEGCISTEELLDQINERTKVVVLSHVEYSTGQRFDLAQLAKAAHDVGALFIVDGIQAAGSFPLHVKKWNVDVYIAGSYKWLCAPFGTAIAYISPALCEKLEPAFTGWRSVEDMWNFNPERMVFTSNAKKFEYSTSAYGVKIGLAEAIHYLTNLGINNIEKYLQKLISLLLGELERIKEINLISPSLRGSIVTFTMNQKDIRDIGKQLGKLSRPINITIRQNRLRVSPHFYNTESDILHFVKNFKKIIHKK
ncbi:MAG: aminotransferase class V-fold PLP-dependent enzyme [Candidatus Hodarchaeales archaeon]|jgi:selenocysteine lyase/cysteine desulfurase